MPEKKIVLERHIEKKVVAHCRRRGFYCRKLSSPACNGIPDRLICSGGKALFLELKRPGQEPTPLQYHEIGKLVKAGMHATWCDSYEQAVTIIDDYFAEDLVG